MIKQETIQNDLISLLEAYTGCTFVPSNTTKPKPHYPYTSFSVINTATRKGTYSKVEVDGKTVLFMPVTQVWSFTVQSDDDAEALHKAMLIVDFFEEVKRLELAEKDIIVADVGAITPRDTLLTIEYEYRKGLDVTLRLNNVIQTDTEQVIDHITLDSGVGEINLEKE